MPINRTHALKEIPKWDYEKATTFCGLEGVKDTCGPSTEYLTVQGNRWEVASSGYRVTCKTCSKHQERAP